MDANGITGVIDSFQWIRVDADGTSNPTDISGATSDTYTLVAADVGKKLKVKASFTDAGGNDEELTSDAYPVSGTVNSPATGKPTISGTAQIGEALSVSTSAIMDANGITGVIDSFQWIRVDADGTSNPTDISGATSDTYTLVAADVGKKLKVKASFTDAGGNDEELTSDAYPVSGTVNSPATGKPTISGTAQIGEALSVSTSAIMDANGITGVIDSFQWIRVDADGTSNPTDISGATSDTYTLVAADVGKKLKVKASFTDAGGNDEELTSDAYPVSGTVNSPATGKPTISGTAQIGEALSVSTSAIMDANGITGVIDSFQWIRVDADGTSNPTDISGATSDTYTLVAADVGKKLKVKASFTDAGGNDEELTSDAYPVSGTVNSPATGKPTISGTAQIGEALSVSTSAIMDANGITGVIDSFQWIRVDADGTSNPTDISGATSDTYTLVAADVGKKLKVKASFTDAGGNDEELTSDAYPVSGTVNSPATGKPTISGTAQIGEALSVSTSAIMDANGITGVIDSFQWIRVDADGTSNPTDISGATSDTYTLVAADVGKKLKVKASFTDAGGNDEELTSDAYPASGTVNSPATGKPTISGTALVLFPLMADTDAIMDANGITGVIDSYQWIRVDGSTEIDIPSATSDSYTLTVADRDKKVRVRASFTDGGGNNEVLVSDPFPETGTVGALNTIATGEVTVAGVFRVGESLSASMGAIRDADGMTNISPEYQWIRADADGISNATDISGATSDTYTPVTADVGKKIRVKVSFRDDINNYEEFTSEAYPSIGTVGRAADSQADTQVTGIEVTPVPPAAAALGSRALDRAAFEALPAGAVHGRGATLTFTLTFDGDVTVNGTPELVLNVFGRERRARYTGGSGSNRLTFGWTVQYGDYDPNGIAVESLALNGATIRNASNQDIRVGVFPPSGFRHFAAHRVRGGFFSAWLAVADTAREGEPFTIRVWRGGGLDEQALMLVRIRDSAAPHGRLVGVTLLPAGSGRIAGRLSDGWTGHFTFTPPADGKADSGRTITVELLDTDLGRGAEGDSWYGLAHPSEVTVRVRESGLATDAPSLSVGPALVFEGSGEPLRFDVRLEPASSSEVRVDYATTRDGTARAGSDYLEASGTLVFAPNETVKTVEVQVLDDAEDEDTETVWLALTNPVGATIGRGSNFGDIDNRTDNGSPRRQAGNGPPTLSVEDATVEEAAGATLDFVVTLSRAVSETVTVVYATADGTATAGSDYTRSSGTLIFAANDTSETVSVPVLNDALDEGAETMTLTLSNPSPSQVKLADASAVGTINNEDAMPQAWLARFGRTLAQQAMDAVEGRFASPRTAGLTGTIGGESVSGLVPGAAGEAAEGTASDDSSVRLLMLAGRFGRDAAEGDAPGRPSFDSRAVTGRALLTGSSFALAGSDGRGGSVAFWGRGSVAHFDGREGNVTLDGEVATAMIGADWAGERSLAGLMLTHSQGEGGYRSESGNGALESALTGLFPYGRHALSERVALWGLAGYGQGRLTLTPEGRTPLRPELTLLMGAVGVRGVLLDGGEEGLTLAAKSSALAARTSSDAVPGLAQADADVTLLRLGLEGARPIHLGASAMLTPSAELGVRHDGGDAETGFGTDIGAGLMLLYPAHGLSAELRARGLLTHEDSGMRERGVSGAVAFDPTPESERGVSLSLGQTLGGPSSGGAGALLARPTLAGLATEDEGGDGDGGDDLARRRFEARLGYGLGVWGERWIAVPEVGLGLSESERELRVGGRLVEAVQVGLAVELGLEATRRESEDDHTGSEHALGLDLGWRLHTPRDGGAALEMRVTATRREPANDDGPPDTTIGLTAIARW